MKKLLLVLVMLFTFSLMACDNSAETTLAPTTAYDYGIDINDLENDLEAQIQSLELQIALLEERLDNLVSVQGMNGNTVYYEKAIRTLSETVDALKDTFDEEKAPSYMQDDKGQYVYFSKLATELKSKYFNATYLSVSGIGNDEYSTIPYCNLLYVIQDETLDINDVIARTILLAEEISNYDYYVLSSNGINIHIVWNDGSQTRDVYLTIPTTVLINDMFILDYDSITGQMFEIKLYTQNASMDKTIIKTYYDDYVLNETFSGYVLDFTK